MIYAMIYAMIYKQCSFLRKQLIIVSPFGRIPQSPSVTAPFRQGSLWVCANFRHRIVGRDDSARRGRDCNGCYLHDALRVQELL